MAFLNQREEEKYRKNDLIINLRESYVAELGFELATPGSAVRRTTDYVVI